MKMRIPPAAVAIVMVSPIVIVANMAVTRGSANRKLLRTAAFTWFAT